MKIVCISDTHGQHGKLVLPGGDLLIVAGDLSSRGEIGVIASFNEWLGQQPHRHKIVIPGNHDITFERSPGVMRSMITNGTLLMSESIEIDGYKIYGSPYTPSFGSWAFMKNQREIALEWAKIPDDTDVLITHGPAYGVLDETVRGDLVGCPELLKRIQEIKPAIHCFGHIHESHGTIRKYWANGQEHTTFVNASVLDEYYAQNFEPIVVKL